MYRFLLGICTIALLPLILHGNNPHFIQFGTQNGLPGSEVYDVALDVNGMPWFATDRGVCSYNGYEFVSYSSRDGLGDNTCLAMQKGPQGELWFFGLNGTISHQSERGIEPFWGNDQFNQLVGQNRVPDGIVWKGNGEVFFWFWKDVFIEVVSYHPQTGEFQLESLSDSLGHRPSIQTPGVNHFDFFGKFIPDIRSPRLILDQHNNAYTNYDSSLIKKYLNFPDSIQKYQLSHIPTELYFDHNGDLWATTHSGLFRFPKGDLNQKPDPYFQDVATSSILQDHEGNYWLTTLENGVYLVPTFDIQSLSLPESDGKPSKISALASLKDHLIFSTIAGEIYAVNSQNELELMVESTGNYGINSYAHQTDDHAMVGRYRFSESEGILQVYRSVVFTYKAVVTVFSNQDVFVGGSNGAQIRLSQSPHIIDAPFKSRVHSILETENKVWIGTIEGLWILEDNDYHHFRRVLPKSDLLQTRINDIQEDGYGNLWLSTLGNSLLHLKDSTLSQPRISYGLTSDIINSTALERPGVLWVGCNNGLHRVRYTCEGDLQVQEVKTFTTEDGLPDNYIVDVAVWNETVWLATNKGLAYFPIETFDQEQTAPDVPLLIKSARANNVPLALNSSANLSHDRNDLLFRFLGVAIRKPKGKPFYRYTLIEETQFAKQDPEFQWIYTNERTVRYLNLPPGQYHFLVSASNWAGSWSKPQSYSFYIEPHYTQTLTFRVIVILLVLFAITGVFAYFSWRYRQHQNQRRKLQEAKLKAQEAEISTLRSQMNPHFVFNALNSIQNFIFKKDVLNANHFLSQFSSLIRDGLRFSRQETIPLSEELAFLLAYLELEAMRFPGRFTYHVEVEEELQSSSIYIIPFLFQPLLENAIKHAFKDIDYEGILKVSIRESQPGWLYVEIRDNGQGFDIQQLELSKIKQASLGLQIVQDRVELLKTEHKFRQAHFELINLEKEDSHGTLARFQIPIQVRKR